MKLKAGVNIVGIQPELMIGLMAAETVYTKLGFELVVTSVLDGTHSETSLHYSGNAADLRTRDFPPLMGQTARDMIAKALPNDFDVILEGDHIHLEFQARKRA